MTIKVQSGMKPLLTFGYPPAAALHQFINLAFISGDADMAYLFKFTATFVYYRYTYSARPISFFAYKHS